MEKPKPHRVHPFLLFLVFVGLAILLLAANMHNIWSGDGANWQNLGARADLFAGIAGPLLSLLAFGGVLYTINLQRKDIAETQADARRQRDAQIRHGFEATFFRMLSLHNEIVNGIDLREKETKKQTAVGRDCFPRFLDRLKAEMKASLIYPSEHPDQDIRLAYRAFWGKHRQDLGHYFRFLFNFIRFVDDAQLPPLDGEEMDPKQKYMKILRAQLSDGELTVLFYNMHSKPGFAFRKYSRHYQLLDNLPRDLLLSPAHADLRAGMGPLDDLPAIGLPPNYDLATPDAVAD